jgi:hypothetical protein
MWRLALAAVVAVTFVIGAPLETAQAKTPAYEAVTGHGEVAGRLYASIRIDARATPDGPTGWASFVVVGIGFVGGPVTCVEVVGDLAVIGINDVEFGFGPVTIVIRDGAPKTGPPDRFEAAPTFTNCLDYDSSVFGGPLVSGGFRLLDV